MIGLGTAFGWLYLRAMLRWLPLILSLFVAPAALSCEPPAPVHFDIRHETFGELGQHVVSFSCDGQRLIVETRAEISVDVLFIQAFRRSVRYVEAWSGEQLVEFFGETVDNGEERSVVRAWLEGDRMVIEGSRGRIVAPPDVIPSHPWNPVSVERTLLFDVVDGTLLEVENRKLGEDYLKIDGEPELARHYQTSGGTRRELWYGPDGSWLQWRLDRQGTVTLTRTSP
ncbi:MAG: DUF6134 family protein [Geminicoccaceae bacterium]|nr:DUF6134 family protein [Geminicoccaceae bacterium]